MQLTVAPATTPAVTLSVASSPFLSVNGGQTLEIPLTLERFAGFNGAVSVDVPGLPPTVVAEVAPFAPGGTSTTLRLHVSELETGGVGNITIRTSAAGIEQASTIVSLRSNAVSKIFLSFGPPVTLQTPVNMSASVTLSRGSSATVPITLTRVAVSQAVGIMVFEKPSGVLLDFPFTLPASNAPQSFGLTINVTANAEPGVYQMMVRGHDMAWARYSYGYLTLTVN